MTTEQLQRCRVCGRLYVPSTGERVGDQVFKDRGPGICGPCLDDLRAENAGGTE